MSHRRTGNDATPILYVKQLPYNVESDTLYEIFGRYGVIRQIRLGSTDTTKGNGYVVYTSVEEAQSAFEHLNGYSISGRYISLSYFRGKLPQTDSTTTT